MKTKKTLIKRTKNLRILSPKRESIHTVPAWELETLEYDPTCFEDDRKRFTLEYTYPRGGETC
jgi:hypothetical protein